MNHLSICDLYIHKFNHQIINTFVFVVRSFFHYSLREKKMFAKFNNPSSLGLGGMDGHSSNLLHTLFCLLKN